MDALIDMVLETVLRSAIWRTTWHMSFEVLIGVAIIAFLLLAYRSRRNRSPGGSSKRSRKRGFKYRDKYPD